MKGREQRGRREWRQRSGLCALACALVLCAAVSPASYALDATTEYVYDDLNQLTDVVFKAAANGKPERTLYTVSYTYDKNGNRKGMIRTPGTLEIDDLLGAGAHGNTFALEILGFAFQMGMEVTLTLEDETVLTGTVTALTPTSAVAAFDYDEWPSGEVTLTLENPDGQSDTMVFTLSEYLLPATGPIGPLLAAVLITCCAVLSLRRYRRKGDLQ